MHICGRRGAFLEKKRGPPVFIIQSCQLPCVNGHQHARSMCCSIGGGGVRALEKLGAANKRVPRHRLKIACQAAIFTRAVHTPVRSRPTSPLLAAFGACSVYTCPVYLLLRKLARSRGGLGQQCVDHRLGRLAGHYRDIYQWNYLYFASAYEGEAFRERRPEPASQEVVKQAYCKMHIASSPFGRGL